MCVCASTSKPACTNMFRVCVLAVLEYRSVFSMTYTTDRQTERLNESVNGGSLVEYIGYERAADVCEVDNRESHECEETAGRLFVSWPPVGEVNHSQCLS